MSYMLPGGQPLEAAVVAASFFEQLNSFWRCVMAGKADQAKGRVKEAAGALTGNRRLKREGKIDQAAGKVKQGAEKVVDKVKRAAKA